MARPHTVSIFLQDGGIATPFTAEREPIDPTNAPLFRALEMEWVHIVDPTTEGQEVPGFTEILERAHARLNC